jgi:hypothetical protein
MLEPALDEDNISPEDEQKIQKHILAYLKQSKQEELLSDPESMSQIRQQQIDQYQQMKISKMHNQALQQHQQMSHLRNKEQAR